MVIDEDLLLKNGAAYENESGIILFQKGDYPHYYFQIVSGKIELNNYHEDGKEFTFNILSDGQSIAESLLFGEKFYPMNAVVKTDCCLLKLPKSRFLKLLGENQEIVFKLFRHLSDRLFYKYIMLFSNSSADPASKIKSLMDYYKESSTISQHFKYLIPLTRQQIANLTGLRVETIIRTVKRMEKENMVKICNRQIYY